MEELYIDTYPYSLSKLMHHISTDKIQVWVTNYTKLVEILINADTYTKLSILKYIAAKDDVTTFEKLILEMGNFDLNCEDNVFLKIAVTNNCFNFLKYLLKNGVDINASDHFAIKAFRNYTMLKLLLKSGANASADNDYPICRSASCDNLENIKLLLKHGANIQARENYLLRMACCHCNLDMIKYLISHGSDIHVDNEEPLRIAACLNRKDIINILLDNGANIHALTKNDLEKIIYGGYRPIIKILADHGVDFTIVNKPLLDKKKENLMETIHLLADIGVDMKALALILYSAEK